MIEPIEDGTPVITRDYVADVDVKGVVESSAAYPGMPRTYHVRTEYGHLLFRDAGELRFDQEAEDHAVDHGISYRGS